MNPNFATLFGPAEGVVNSGTLTHFKGGQFGVIPDWEIEALGIVHPFSPSAKREKVISYGVSSYGYDVRLGYNFKVFKPFPCTTIDPKDFDKRMLEEVTLPQEPGAFITIPPHSFALCESLERFTIPRDIMCLVVGKSTYARCGAIVNVTPGEPEWDGIWTIEISNTAPLPLKVYAGEGIMQCVFFRGSTCRESYADKKGKYQNQTGIKTPEVDTKPN